MDAWNPDQLRRMQLGGNDKLNKFLAQVGGLCVAAAPRCGWRSSRWQLNSWTSQARCMLLVSCFNAVESQSRPPPPAVRRAQAH